MAEQTAPAFTPGPWKVHRGNGCWHVMSADQTFQTGCITFRGNSHANAGLVAAAPELYEALKLYVDHFGDPLKVARAALAKAEGR